MASVHDAVHVPADSEHVIRVGLDDLPPSADEAMQLLEVEPAVLPVWMDMARAYMASGQSDQALAILKIIANLTDEQIVSAFPDQRLQTEAQLCRARALCALAHHELVKASKASPDERAAAANEATRKLQQASNYTVHEQFIGLTQGCLFEHQDNALAARQAYKAAQALRSGGRRSVAATVAMGHLLYSEGKFEDALASFASALEWQPEHGCNDIRIALGACYFRLGDLELARLAYERALSLEPGRAEALVGLVALKLTGPDRDVQEGLILLSAAYEADPGSAPVLHALATCHLLQGNYSAAEEMASEAVVYSATKEMEAQALCTLARLKHAQNLKPEAHRLYSRSLNTDETPLAQYGLAQMLIDAGEVKNSMTQLEHVLRTVHSNVDALMLLGRLYLHSQAGKGGTAKAEKLSRIQDAARKFDTNAEVQELLGDVLAQSDPAGALKAYKAAVALHERSQAPENGKNGENGASEAVAPASTPGVKLLNNLGVMYYRSGQKDTARDLFTRGLEHLRSGDEQQLPMDVEPTLLFNIARCSEACGDHRAAEAGYNEVLAKEPDYLDCYVRLAYMLYARGQPDDADRTLKQRFNTGDGAHASQPMNDDALTVLALVRSKQKNFDSADRYAKKLMSLTGKTDNPGARAFSHVVAGNVHFLSCPMSTSNVKELKQHVDSAARHYMDALKLQPGNIYAANGLGALAALMDQLDTARDIFMALREGAASTTGFVQLPDVWTNLGSIHLALYQPEEAARMYEAVQTRFLGRKDVEVLRWQARSHYGSRDYRAAKRTLLRAIHLDPSNPPLLFNLAVSMQASASAEFAANKAASASSVRPLQAAQLEFAQAEHFFKRLQQLPDKLLASHKIGRKQLELHAQYCGNESASVHQHLNVAQQILTNEMQLLDQRKQQAEFWAQSEAVMQQMKEDEKKAEIAHQQARWEEHQRQVREKNRKWQEKKAMEDAAKKGDADGAAAARKRARQQQQRGPEIVDDREPLLMLDDEGSSEDEDFDAGALAHEERADDEDLAAFAADVRKEEERKERKKSKKGSKKHKKLKRASLTDAQPSELADDMMDQDDDAGEPSKKQAALLGSDDEGS